MAVGCCCCCCCCWVRSLGYCLLDNFIIFPLDNHLSLPPHHPTPPPQTNNFPLVFLEHFQGFVLLSCVSTFNLRLFPRGSSCLVWGARLLGRSRYFQSHCQGWLSLGVCCCIFVFVWRGEGGDKDDMVPRVPMYVYIYIYIYTRYIFYLYKILHIFEYRYCSYMIFAMIS